MSEKNFSLKKVLAKRKGGGNFGSKNNFGQLKILGLGLEDDYKNY